MLNTAGFGKTAVLAKSISPSDRLIQLASGEGAKFPLKSGEHFYLTLNNGGTREVVKVVARTGDTLTVDRAQDGTSAQSFPRETCVGFEWNPAQLCEFVKQCVGGCAKIEAQVINVTCGTAIEINECGNIVSVNGSAKC